MIEQQELELEGFLLMTSYCLYVSTVSPISCFVLSIEPPDYKTKDASNMPMPLSIFLIHLAL